MGQAQRPDASERCRVTWLLLFIASRLLRRTGTLRHSATNPYGSRATLAAVISSRLAVPPEGRVIIETGAGAPRL
jgi:hypothetical protein